MPKFLQSVDENSSDTIAPRSRSPLKFFLLVFGLSVPFWLTGADHVLTIDRWIAVSDALCASETIELGPAKKTGHSCLALSRQGWADARAL